VVLAPAGEQAVERVRVRQNPFDRTWVVYRGPRWVTWRLTWRDAMDAAWDHIEEKRKAIYEAARAERFGLPRPKTGDEEA
jgi:hypothetical protein